MVCDMLSNVSAGVGVFVAFGVAASAVSFYFVLLCVLVSSLSISTCVGFGVLLMYNVAASCLGRSDEGRVFCAWAVARAAVCAGVAASTGVKLSILYVRVWMWVVWGVYIRARRVADVALCWWVPAVLRGEV